MKKVKKIIVNMLSGVIGSANETNAKLNKKIKEKDGGESDYLKESFYKEIKSEDDWRLMYEINIANTTYVFSIIVDKKSMMIKDNHDIYFVLTNTLVYNKDNFELSNDDLIHSLSLSMLGSKISLLDKDRLKFAIQNEFIMNYGAFNNPGLYEKMLAFNFFTAIKLSNEASSELAKTLDKK
ncbi:hypothetical protein [Morganella morganii]|uniref:hypothetical protein n=1 Tax=Morganella morganii TaxID=582 RepID=UPI002231C01D|nr:hypothetical protein [Morganella morganii]MDM8753506.1 hypothetical protein [Morganella morganii]